MNSAIVFDRHILRLRRERVARSIRDTHFFSQPIAQNLYDRASLIKKDLPIILDLSAGAGGLSDLLRTRPGTKTVISSDLSWRVLEKQSGPSVVADEEFLPFADGSLDAVFCNMGLHWVNDLPGTLSQIKRILKPDGVFIAALAGGQSLSELKESLMAAELAVTGGYRPRTSPLLDMRDMGALLQRAGFALPVIDSEMITVDYRDPMVLLSDLRAAAATNLTTHRAKTMTPRKVLFEAARMYQEKFQNTDGRIPASIEVIYAIGWRPHDSQQKPLKPGSASARLAEVLNTVEQNAGEKITS
jgi:SAM-dependent methyltransferase